MAVISKTPKRTIKGKYGGTLTPYPKGVSGNPAGPKKSHLTLIREALELKYDWKVSKNDAEQLLKLLLFAPREELEKLAENPEIPAVVLNYIQALFADIKAGRVYTANLLMSTIDLQQAKTPAGSAQFNFFSLASNQINDGIKKLIDVTPNKAKNDKGIGAII